MQLSSNLRHTCSVAIVGDGFSGAATSIALLRNPNFCGKIVLIGPNPHTGRGIAYGTTSPAHVLNVRAEAMSIFPEDPLNFVSWLRSHHPRFGPHDFVPRSIFGEYIEDTVDSARTLAKERAELVCAKTRATGIKRATNSEFLWEIGTESGQKIEAQAFVAAVGNAMPRSIPGLDSESSDGITCQNPWTAAGLTGCADWKRAILIGSGLTAIDTILELIRKNFNGELLLVSRRGLLPLAHYHAPGTPISLALPKSFTLRKLTRSLIAEGRRQVASQMPWQAVMDGIRGNTQQLWSKLNLEEKRRFLRHLRPYWDVHRHRMAPEVQHAFSKLRDERKLSILAGRIQKISRLDSKNLTVSILPRGASDVLAVECDQIINCTGPSEYLAERNDAFVGDIVSKLSASTDALKLGLVVNEHHQIVHDSGTLIDNAYAMGTLCRGLLWETTAVRELRVQAQLISNSIIGHFSSGRNELAGNAS